MLSARVIEHAEKRKRQRETSKQRASSKANTQLSTMSIVVGGTRADSAEEVAEAERKPDPEITEEEERGKLLTMHKWKLAQFNRPMLEREVSLSARAWLCSWMSTNYMALHYKSLGYVTITPLCQTNISIEG